MLDFAPLLSKTNGMVLMQLDELLKPTWSAQRSLNKAWSILNAEEKEIINQRVKKLFDNELPFQLNHDKLVYVHLFSLLAQLETIALGGLIKSLEKLTGTSFYQSMHQQIIDEIFHAIVFVKLTFQLSAPYALPLDFDKSISHFIVCLEGEEDLTTSLTLTNLVAEGWVEELCLAMIEKNIAVNIFEEILKDESRHLNEYDLYCKIGLPKKDYLKQKLGMLEEELINTVFSQEQCAITMLTLLGRDGLIKLFNQIDKKEHSMLKTIGLTPSSQWQVFMKNMPLLLGNIFHNVEADKIVEVTPTRKALSSLGMIPNHLQNQQFLTSM